MKKQKHIAVCFAITFFCLLLFDLPVMAELASGEGVVVAQTGKVYARYPVESIHEGRTQKQDLFTGVAFGELATLQTGRDGHACIVLSPGALLHLPPNTRVVVRQLRHTAKGLPRSEADIIRRIALDLQQGGLYLDAGVPTASLDLRVTTPAGEIKAQGGVFSVASGGDGTWTVLCEDYEITLSAPDGSTLSLNAGDTARLDGSRVQPNATGFDPTRHQFKLCRGFFRDLGGFRDPIRGFRLESVASYVGLSGSPARVGKSVVVADVSPSFRAPLSSETSPVTPASIGAPDGKRWKDDRIWRWWQDAGVIRGVNYIPRNCANSVEMWKEDTFDSDLIAEELDWAKGLGYTAIRIPLQFAVWKADADGFVERVDHLLRLAEARNIRVVPVLFDDLNRAGQDPVVGPQPDPDPGVHNPLWVPSPGPSLVTDQSHWDELETYVSAVVKTFKRDDRILYWDLYNHAGDDGLKEQSLPLLDQAFNWVRDIDPTQPLAVAAWTQFGSAMTTRKLERSDLVTFESFETPQQAEALLALLQRHDRPLICTDWLMRQKGNDFESMLPLFSEHRVGWFNHGLVNGRTQTWLQQAEFRSDTDPDLWQHDVLKPDGTPYDSDEAELIRGFRYATEK